MERPAFHARREDPCRHGRVQAPRRVRVRTVFDAESENPAEMQREGWQAILDNFGRYTEAKSGDR